MFMLTWREIQAAISNWSFIDILCIALPSLRVIFWGQPFAWSTFSSLYPHLYIHMISGFASLIDWYAYKMQKVQVNHSSTGQSNFWINHQLQTIMLSSKIHHIIISFGLCIYSKALINAVKGTVPAENNFFDYTFLCNYA